MHVYLDNAATTASYPDVFEAMRPYLSEFYGNPSSAHNTGRKTRVAIEQARKTIAKIIGANASEIIFTSGGTAANNIFLQGIAPSISHIISSPIEHPAVLHTLTYLDKIQSINLSFLTLEKDGQVSLGNLEEAILKYPGALVVLMHGNNEVGNLLLLEKVSTLCKRHNCNFFTDAVQTIGHYPINLSSLHITGLAASAHKFHGPKGAGFLYLKQGTKLSGIYHGGAQERGLSVGTENVAGIVGMARALEIAHLSYVEDKQHIEMLKKTMIDLLTRSIPGVKFNGSSANITNSINTVLSVSLPTHEQNEMLLFNLDLANISVSAGSACASGAATESHVLKALKHDSKRGTIRFSFSYLNTVEELRRVVKKLRDIYKLD